MPKIGYFNNFQQLSHLLRYLRTTTNLKAFFFPNTRGLALHYMACLHVRTQTHSKSIGWSSLWQNFIFLFCTAFRYHNAKEFSAWLHKRDLSLTLGYILKEKCLGFFWFGLVLFLFFLWKHDFLRNLMTFAFPPVYDIQGICNRRLH